MLLAYLTLITGLAISAVAIYYSVIGLAAIFSAAVIPIVIMGAILEVSKLVSAWWLKANWERAPILLKSYMLVAVVVLMIITSMGIFGFLSKAHTDQAITSGDVQSRIALYDEKKKIERENIANAQSVIKQMDAAVNGVIATGDQEFKRNDGTTGVRSAAERSLQIRRSQAKDREALTKQIEASQDRIVKLQEEAAPIRSEVRKVEAEVGPIKYIAKLIYGDNPDNNLLEKAVTWVIITIVFVFDPLAVLLLLASQMSFQWAREQRGERNELVQEKASPQGGGEETPTPSQSFVGEINETDGGESDSGSGSGGNIQEVERVEVRVQEAVDVKEILDDSKSKLNVFLTKLLTTKKFDNKFELFDLPKAGASHTAEIHDSKLKIETKENLDVVEGLEAWNKMIEEAEKAIDEEKTQTNVIWTDDLKQWREKNMDADVFAIQRSYDAGEITELPWEAETKKYKILPELIDQSSYVQNEEQKESNLWQEARKNVEVPDKESLSQEDYQKKVQKAIIRDLIKNINEGSITVTDLTEEEIKNIEDYLKENDDRKNNTDQSA